MTVTTFDPTSLYAGDSPRLLNDKVTIKSGAGVLPRGTVLGRIAGSSAASAAKSGGNTGNGALTLDVTTPIIAGVQTGVYQVRCTTAATNGGTFTVYDPAGDVIGTVAVGATFASQIKFAIADGSSDFIVGDGFDITVATTGKYVKSLAAATDGSQVPDAILATDIDATSADVDCQAYVGGMFASEKLTYGAGHSITTVNAAFRDSRRIQVRSVGAVA